MPDVRVGSPFFGARRPCFVTVMLCLATLQRDPGGNRRDGGVTSGRQRIVQPIVQADAVTQDDVRVFNRDEVAGGRLELVRVGTGRHDAVQIDQVASHFARQRLDLDCRGHDSQLTG